MFFHETWYIRVIFSLPVCLVVTLSCTLYYCFYTGYVLLVPASAPLMLVLLILHFCLFMYAWSYFRTIITDPGSTPANFDVLSTDRLLSDNEGYNEQDWDLCKASFCKKCKRNRPARAHHCSGCNRCILRMDHHCPWVGNCVGNGNHKFFAQFLVYSLTSCIIIACLSGNLLISQGDEYELTTMFATLVSLCLSAALGGLAGVNVWLIACNKTTLEMHKQGYNVFDLSTEENWEQICGSQWLYWVLPIKPPNVSDGVVYPIKLRAKTGEAVTIYDKIVASQ